MRIKLSRRGISHGRCLLTVSDKVAMYVQSIVLSVLIIAVGVACVIGRINVNICLVAIGGLVPVAAFNLISLSRSGCAALVFCRGRVCIWRPVSGRRVTFHVSEIDHVRETEVHGSQFVVIEVGRVTVVLIDAEKKAEFKHQLMAAIGWSLPFVGNKNRVN